jgi:hypothetical protein
VIEEFSNYSINQEGHIRNNNTNHNMALTRNQQGIIQVGLVRDRVQYKRAVALLVAKAFLYPPTPSSFDTPINLDGDRSNCHAENLMWRPRWFAILYHKQFHNGKRGFRMPVIELNSRERFPSSWEAAIKFGLLDREIMIATLNRTYVWPTYQEFRLVE